MKKAFLILTAILLLVLFAEAQSKIVPIIDMKVAGLLGGVRNGKFLDAETTVKTMREREDYTLYLFGGTVERILNLKKPTKFCPDAFYNLDFSESDGGFYDNGGTALGAGYDWNPLPRTAKPISLKSPAYEKIVADFLRPRGVAKPLVNLTQAIRVDLDGDGQEEVLLAATRIVPYIEKDGKKAFDEYSVVLLRKIVSGKPQTIFLAGDVVLKNRYEYDESNSIISSVLDLNGDGKMEIVIFQGSAEGISAKVFEKVGKQTVEVKSLSVENGGECY